MTSKLASWSTIERRRNHRAPTRQATRPMKEAHPQYVSLVARTTTREDAMLPWLLELVELFFRTMTWWQALLPRFIERWPWNMPPPPRCLVSKLHVALISPTRCLDMSNDVLKTSPVLFISWTTTWKVASLPWLLEHVALISLTTTCKTSMVALNTGTHCLENLPWWPEN